MPCSFRHVRTAIDGNPWRAQVAIVLCVICLCGLPLSALPLIDPPVRESDLSVQRFGTKDGLSNSDVRAIMRDSKGFMWFATGDGLNKFDGYQFTEYKPERHDSNSISENSIAALCEASDGLLWIGTSDGRLNSFDRLTEDFRCYDIDGSTIQGTAVSSIIKIIEDRQRQLWLITQGGQIFRFDPATAGCLALNERFTQVYPEALSRRFALDVIEDRSGAIWLGTVVGLVRYLPESGRIDQFLPQPNPLSRAHSHFVMKIICQEDSSIALCTQSSLYTFNPADQSFTTLLHIKLPQFAPGAYCFSTFARQADGSYWLGTFNNGLLHFSTHNQEVIRHERHALNPNSLSGNSIRALATDNLGTLWCGTRFGLNKLSAASQQFSGINGERAYIKGMRHSVVRSLYHDSDGELLIGTDGGLYSTRDKGGDSIRRREELAPSDGENYPLNAIYRDRLGWMWFGYTGIELIAHHPATEQVRRYRNLSDTSSQLIGHVFCFEENRHGTLYIGTGRGLLRFNRATETFDIYKLNETMHADPVLYVFDILEVSEGMLWLATNDGICVFDQRSASFVKHYEFDERDSGSLSSDEVWCLHRDKRGRLWVCTFGQGINLYDPQSDTFRCYNEAQGLPGGAALGMLEDSRARLWISTTKGLSRFDPQTDVFRNFDVHDGLQSNEFYFGAYHRSRHTGELFFGSVNGFNRFHPDSIRDNPHPPPLAITGLKVFGRRLRPEMFNGDSVQLSYRENFVSFTFAALDYTNPGQHQYAYILEGVDPEWVNCGTRRYAEYTNLPGGSYTFRVKGSNNDGVWNEPGIAISLTITPPIWQTLAFRIGLALLLIGIAACGMRLRIKAVQRKAALQHKVLESELEALRLQMNPHFMFNSLHSIQNYIIKHDQDRAYTYLARFASLMRMTLENSGEQEITLARELRTLELYLELETLRFEHKIRYDIELDRTIDRDRLMVPPLLLQPYVENAIVHGLQPKRGQGVVKIRVRRRGRHIVCTVEDDGAGRAYARRLKQRNTNRHLSIGTRVARKRLERLSTQHQQSMHVSVTDLYDFHGQAAGTRVDITLAATIRSDGHDKGRSVLA